MTAPAPPMGMLAELTHRCPLRCPYCSNPLELERAAGELSTEEWLRTIDEAADLGVLQIHFSGGEPTLRRDLGRLVARAREREVYSNLITAGVLLDRRRIDALASAGLEHVQLSLQDSRSDGADAIGGYRGGHEKKLAVARMVRAAGLPLTINAVVHRQNLHHLDELIELSVALGAGRLEIAHAQYHGWAYLNRAALMPTRDQVDRAADTVAAARERLRGVLAIDYVPPDYYARWPKACMGGWGRRFLNVTPVGRVLPCHAAESIPDMRFETVRERSLAAIWMDGPAFERFRGTSWMAEPCRSCDRREIDFGGCRCQAFALTGDAAATDPACSLSPEHGGMVALAEAEAGADRRDFVYRGMARSRRPAGDRPAAGAGSPER